MTARAGVEFGVFDWVDRRDTPLQRLYEERLALIEAADTLGFFSYHLAEHHATPLGMAPSPSVFLAAVAQRTRRIRLGPLVYLLPLYSPLRLIGEICMLDHLSGGRLDLGIGRGVSPYEVGYHGIDPATTRAMFLEALSVILAGLQGDRLTFKGTHYRYENVPMELSPLQRPYPPLWFPTGSLENLDWAASNGLQLVGLAPAAAYRAFVDRYRAVHAQHAGDPDRLNPHVPEPRIGITRLVVVADTDAEAEAIARAAHPQWARSFVKLWEAHGDRSVRDRVKLLDLPSALRDEDILCGAPDRVRTQVRRLVETSGVDYVIGSFAWGDLTAAQSLRSVRLFAEHVMPAFRG